MENVTELGFLEMSSIELGNTDGGVICAPIGATIVAVGGVLWFYIFT